MEQEKTQEKNNSDQKLEDVKSLLKKNLEISKELQEQVKKIRSYINFLRLATVLKIFLIAIPVILGIIYLPPVFEKFFGEIMSIYEKITIISGSR